MGVPGKKTPSGGGRTRLDSEGVIQQRSKRPDWLEAINPTHRHHIKVLVGKNYDDYTCSLL